MMSEIYHRGPIACGISVTDDLYKHYTGGVFYDKTNASMIDHDISVVGYGVDKPTGLKYWLIRNSWGTYWVSFHFMGKTIYACMTLMSSIFYVTFNFTLNTGRKRNVEISTRCQQLRYRKRNV